MSGQHNIIKQWIEKAENDLRNAEHTFTLRENCPYDTICFHAQQCVEKYIKALLIHLAIDFPKIHDIGELIRLVPPNYDIPISKVDQEKLTDYSIASRYPLDLEPVTDVEAHETVLLAR